jgi:hypothetical protein
MNHAARTGDGFAVIECSELLNSHLSALQSGVGFLPLRFRQRIDPQAAAPIEFGLISLVSDSNVAVEGSGCFTLQFHGHWHRVSREC